MLKKCKVVMLPNEKAISSPDFAKNHIVKCIKEWTPVGEEPIKEGTLSWCVNHSEGVLTYYEPQHLYFLSDEEIKQGDWCYDKVLNIIFQTDEYTDFKYINQTDNVLKIIATTDSSLRIEETLDEDDSIRHFLPEPSQSFIEKYVEEYNKGNVITEVLVEYEEYGIKFELKKLIDLEPFQSIGHRVKTNPKDNTITIRKVRDSWTREEVIKIINKISEEVDFESATQKTIDRWIEKNL